MTGHAGSEWAVECLTPGPWTSPPARCIYAGPTGGGRYASEAHAVADIEALARRSGRAPSEYRVLTRITYASTPWEPAQ